jgi:glycosyltransferase involved in cell wall biosynthesis
VALPALAARRLRGIPFVFEIRDPWPELPRAMGVGGPALWWGLDRLADAACRHAAAVVALSDGMADTARARGAAWVTVVPNGCDLDLFGPQVAPWRPGCVPEGQALAVYAGAQGPANGVVQLLKAAALLQAEAAPVTLLLVGEGAETAGLRQRVIDWGLGNVRFLPPQPKTRLAGLLAGADIGLHCLAPIPDFADLTSPNKLMDGLAAGLPVVSNLGPGAARLLEGDTPCGIATAPGDTTALAAAISALVDDPARRAAMGAAGRALAERRWDRRLLAARFAEVAENAARPAAQAAEAMA